MSSPALIFFLALLLPPPLPAQAQSWGPFTSEGQSFIVTKVIDKRGVIWAMEFIAPNKLLFTERQGKLFKLNLSTQRLTEITGLVPAMQIAQVGQGGLLDLKLHPSFSRNSVIFLTYAKKIAPRHYTTALVSAVLKNHQLSHVQELFSATPPNSHSRHFGSRMAIQGRHLFFSVGDRAEREHAQRLTDDWGKIHRINLDGTIPADNPFYQQPGARKTIYSYGHRNPQGLAFNPLSDKLWSHEHGPRGGDEINLIQPGANYGWPTISYGKEYWGPIQVGEGVAKEGMEQPLKYYIPSIAPSGMAFYQGQSLGPWQGHLFLGSLAYHHLNHLVIEQGKIVRENRLLKSLNMRIREVVTGVNGQLYLSTDEGSILKISPWKQTSRPPSP